MTGATRASVDARLRTVRELADELRFSSEDACRTWLRRHRVPVLRRGRVILVDPRDLDLVLRRIDARRAQVRPDRRLRSCAA